MRHKPYVQRWWIGLALLSIALGLILFGSGWRAYAQDGSGNRQVSVGDVITATLDSETFVQIYTLPASAGDTITIEASTEVDDLAPVIVITDQRGNVVAQDTDISTAGTAAVTDFSVPANGTYFIHVMRGSGAGGESSGEFTLRITGVQQVGGQMVSLTDGGMTFELTWEAAVNLNLEVRDPVGGTVHAFNTGAPSGGTLDADVNANCASAIADNPTETIAWPAGEVPGGSYEIIIYYLDACDVGGPQVFTLTANVNNGTPESLTGTLNPGQRYLARLELAPDATWTLVNGGVNAGLDVSVFGNQIQNAEPVALGSTISGVITNEQPANAYTFEATAGTTVTISMQAQSGSLDAYLALLAPDNTVLVVNDDANDQTTDAAIERNLVVDGTYTIIATRYGLNIGGTEGDYRLVVGTSTTATPVTGTPVPGATPVEGQTTTLDLPEGSIEVTLTWNTNADLQLAVRDPNGETVYDDVPEVRSGGILASAGNVGCEATTTTPVSYIYWPPNRLLPGTYEVEVWFQSNCDDTAPVNFALVVSVNNQTIINTTSNIALNAHYMITFDIGADGTATAGLGDFFNMANANSLNYQNQLDTAQAITYGATVTGSITAQNRMVLYSFEGTAGDNVIIGMNASSGTLDPALFLISPEGIQVAFNDDVSPGENKNSVIEAALASTGTYTIIATHYGLHVGGTIGTFTLDLRLE